MSVPAQSDEEIHKVVVVGVFVFSYFPPLFPRRRQRGRSEEKGKAPLCVIGVSFARSQLGIVGGCRREGEGSVDRRERETFESKPHSVTRPPGEERTSGRITLDRMTNWLSDRLAEEEKTRRLV